MGLKIKYRFTFKGTEVELASLMSLYYEEVEETIGQDVQASITQIFNITWFEHSEEHCKMMYPKDPFAYQLLVQGFTGNGTKKKGIGFIVHLAEQDNVYFTVALANTEENQLEWNSCYCETRTQYIYNFFTYHVLFCTLIYIAETLGFGVEVIDGGQFYETKSIDVLKEQLVAFDKALEKLKADLVNQGAAVKMGTDGIKRSYEIPDRVRAFVDDLYPKKKRKKRDKIVWRVVDPPRNEE